MFAYSLLVFVHLTKKYLDGAKPRGARLTRFPSFGPRYAKVSPTRGFGEDPGPATLAVALVRSKWFIATNIIGGTSIGQLTQNVDAADVALDDAIHTANDEIHHR